MEIGSQIRLGRILNEMGNNPDGINWDLKRSWIEYNQSLMFKIARCKANLNLTA